MPVESPGTQVGPYMENYTFQAESTQERHLFPLSVLGVESHPYKFLLAKRSVSQVTAWWAGPVEVPKGWALELDGLQCESGPDIFPDEWLWANGFSFLCLGFLICHSGENQMGFSISLQLDWPLQSVLLAETNVFEGAKLILWVLSQRQNLQWLGIVLGVESKLCIPA